ncbi:MAG: amino acid racemase [Salinisphaera sp.]|nr:amino acid racemase [Salinisphaera sp.]
MKHVGIAAITAEGAALVYRQICHLSEQIIGEFQHPEITLHSFSFSAHRVAAAQRREKWGELLKASAAKLRASGADFMICPSNTPHAVYDDIQDDLPLPWLHIVDPVRDQARAAGAKNLLLLGTRVTLEGDFYDRRFQGSGVALLRPQDADIQRVNDIIEQELIKGLVTDTSRRYMAPLLAGHAAAGADGVILGCTELPMIITDAITDLALLDTTTLLAEAAVRQAMA